MKRYSSTTVRLFEENCPAALGFHENNAPQFRDIFQTGVAAHAVLQTIGEKNARTPEQQRAVADAVVEELITKGRSYRGTPEPPMAPDAAFAGRDLAIEWLSYNELPPAGIYEREFFGDSLGLEYAGLIDLAYVETRGGEDYEYKAFVVRDYKTAWVAKDNELDTLQRRGQAVLARANLPKDCQSIVQEVWNLRLGMRYEREILLDDEGEKLLKQWASDIEILCRAAGSTRAPRAGFNCIGCPYILGCDDGKALIEQVDNKAKTWAGAKALLQALEPMLKKQALENPIDDGEGGQVGYEGKEKRRVNAEAVEQLCGLWYPDGTATDGARGILTAAGLGVRQVENIVKSLFPDDYQSRQEVVELCVERHKEAEFKVLKK